MEAFCHDDESSAAGTIDPVRAVMLEVPQALLDERRAKGLDKSDEMWEGELHMVPPPSGEHQEVGAELFLVLGPLAKGRGLLPRYDPTGLFRPGVDDDWRVPDQVYAPPDRASDRGIEGAASLVVEILSPHDETYEKLDWYAEVGVGEVLVIDPGTRRVELFANRDGRMVPMDPADVQALGVRAETVDGKLRLTWEGGSADI
jgi:Uma2 family endonuclease